MLLIPSRPTWDLQRAVRFATFVVAASATIAARANTVSDLPPGTRSSSYDLNSSHRAIRGNRITEQMYATGTLAVILGRLNFEPVGSVDSGSTDLSLGPGTQFNAQSCGDPNGDVSCSNGERNDTNTAANIPNNKLVGSEQSLEGEILDRLDPELASLNLFRTAHKEDVDLASANLRGHSRAWVRDGVGDDIRRDCKVPEPASVVLLGVSLAIMGIRAHYSALIRRIHSRRGRVSTTG